MELIRAGRRLFLAEPVNLPDPGALEISFEEPAAGQELAVETRALVVKRQLCVQSGLTAFSMLNQNVRLGSKGIFLGSAK
jgi:hypothetical protein